jgi:Protein tyrosine phosphatase-like protein, PTPLA
MSSPSHPRASDPAPSAQLPQVPPFEERFAGAWILVTNWSLMYGWAKVLRTFYRHWRALQDVGSSVCLLKLTPDVRMATLGGFLELFNAMLGSTRSNPRQVLLFCVVRAGVEYLVAPHLPSCSQWQHLMTVFLWSLGDTIRFGCFFLDSLVPGGNFAKSVRYTAGPVLFPLGALGEMLMVIALAQHTGNKFLYAAAMLWPVGFYPLMKQLLKQRRKFFHPPDQQKSIKLV